MTDVDPSEATSSIASGRSTLARISLARGGKGYLRGVKSDRESLLSFVQAV